MLPHLGCDRRDSLLSSISTAASTEDLERQDSMTKAVSEVGSSSTQFPSGGDDNPCSTSNPIEFRLSYKRNVRAAARIAWAYITALVLLATFTIVGVDFILVSGSSYMTYYLLFLLVAPLGYVAKHIGLQLTSLDRDHCFTVLNICIQNKYQRHLMEGLRWQLAHTQGLENYAEVTVEGVENPHGGTSLEVELRPTREMVYVELQRGSRSEHICVEMAGGEAQSGGMPNRASIQARSSGRLQFLSSAFRGAHASAQIEAAQDDLRVFLHAWLQRVYADYMRTNTGVIEVYELTKDGPADAKYYWQRCRKERSVSVGGKGTFTYCPGDWAITLKNRAEYAVRHRGKNRVSLFVSGRKGCGKTLFVEWLAGELCLPLYSVDLCSPHVTNEVLREMITPGKLAHNLPVIFHIDEFQSIIQEWSEPNAGATLERKKKSLVTIQGMQTMLEGTSTPNNAIFVFTSSSPLPDLKQLGHIGLNEQHEWRGLLRRLPVQVAIPTMGPEQRKEYCRKFLLAYLNKPWDSDSPRELHRWLAFEKEWAQIEEGVPFDMMAKYAQERTQVSYIVGMMNSFSEGCKVKEECREAFLDGFFSPDNVIDWINEYAGSAVVASGKTIFSCGGA